MMFLLAAVQRVHVTNWPTPTPAPQPTPDAMLAAAQELNRATWYLGHVTFWLVVVTLLAFVAAASAALWTYGQLRETKNSNKRVLTADLIASEMTRNFANGLRFFLRVDDQYRLLLARSKFKETAFSPHWSDEKDNAFAAVLAFLAYTASLYSTNALDDNMLMTAVGDGIAQAFYILEPVLITNIESGINDANILDLVNACLAFRKRRKRGFKMGMPLDNYQVPTPNFGAKAN